MTDTKMPGTRDESHAQRGEMVLSRVSQTAAASPLVGHEVNKVGHDQNYFFNEIEYNRNWSLSHAMIVSIFL